MTIAMQIDQLKVPARSPPELILRSTDSTETNRCPLRTEIRSEPSRNWANVVDPFITIQESVRHASLDSSNASPTFILVPAAKNVSKDKQKRRAVADERVSRIMA